MKYEENNSNEEITMPEEYGCPFCWDKKKQQEKELYFFDHKSNLRLCYFCPNCGRKYQEVEL